MSERTALCPHGNKWADCLDEVCWLIAPRLLRDGSPFVAPLSAPAPAGTLGEAEAVHWPWCFDGACGGCAPSDWPHTGEGFRCAQVGPDTTREQLIAGGIKPEAADEILAFRERLRRKHGALSDAEPCGCGSGRPIAECAANHARAPEPEDERDGEPSGIMSVQEFAASYPAVQPSTGSGWLSDREIVAHELEKSAEHVMAGRGGLLDRVTARAMRRAAAELRVRSPRPEPSTPAETREDALIELVKHMQVHDGYRRNGYMQMTTEQKRLYDEIERADADALARTPAAPALEVADGKEALRSLRNWVRAQSVRDMVVTLGDIEREIQRRIATYDATARDEQRDEEFDKTNRRFTNGKRNSA